MYSPRWLFFYPGIILTVVGLLLSSWLIGGERHIGHLSIDVDTLAYALGMLLIGVQVTVFALSAKLFGTREGFLPPNPRFEKALRTITLEAGLILGVLLLLAGVGTGIYAVMQWHAAGFGAVAATHMLRLTLPSACALMLGVEAIFASFFLGLLQIHRR